MYMYNINKYILRYKAHINTNDYSDVLKITDGFGNCGNRSEY